MNPSLFRLSIPALPADPAAAGLLSLGLQRHLQDAALMALLVASAGQQRSYVALAGCAGCATRTCHPGCRVESLRRTLRAACGPTSDLHPLVRGLAPRDLPYAVLVLPNVNAQPFPLTLIAGSPEFQLSLRWAVGARVAGLVQSRQPLPKLPAQLADLGWQAWPLSPLARRWWQYWPARHFPGEPWLPLLAEPSRPPVPALAPTSPADLAHCAALSERLTQMLAGTQVTPSLETSDPWPAGPHHAKSTLAPPALAALIDAILADPAIGDAAEPGLRRGRLAPLLPSEQRCLITPLLVWWADAGLLAPPTDPGQPWRRARPLTTTDRDAIRLRLLATPLPDAAALAAAREQGLR